jgi:hypothetical protein
MSFLDSLVDLGKSAIGFLSGNSVGANLARTAITGYALNRITNTVNKENEKPETKRIDPGVRIQVDPSPDYRVPVVYGEAVLGGIITDAVLTNGNQTMYFCITICERTGLTDLGTGPQSTFTFNDIYWNDNRLSFQSDGITVAGWTDKSETFTDKPNGKIKVWCFDGNSTRPTIPTGYTNAATDYAYNIFPGWASGTHFMNDLVFAIVRVDYAADQDVKGLGNMKFKISNSLTLPGDVLYDYMTNTRYGAGIAPEEIYAQ